MSKKILVIEDEVTINRIICSYLEREGYTVCSAEDGLKGIVEFEKEQPDLVCLDVMMPGMNGWEVSKLIREKSDTPIIMMTSLSSEEDMIKGFSLQVDDYITKPFNPKIFIARVQAVLKRSDNPVEVQENNEILTAGVIRLDLSEYRAYIQEKEVELSKTEFQLLAHFMRNQRKICSREYLLDEVWGMDVYVDDRTVDAYVKKLRKHLGDHKYITTVFGVGYRFEV